MKYSNSFIEMFNSLGEKPDIKDIDFLVGFASGLSTMGSMADKKEYDSAMMFLKIYETLSKKYQSEIDDLKDKLDISDKWKRFFVEDEFKKSFIKEKQPNTTVVLTSPKCGSTRFLMREVLCSAYEGNKVIYIGDHAGNIIKDMIDIYYNDVNEDVFNEKFSHISFLTPPMKLTQDDIISSINVLEVDTVYIDNISVHVEDIQTENEFNQFILSLKSRCPHVKKFVISYMYAWTNKDYDFSEHAYFLTGADSVILLSKNADNETEKGFFGHYKYLKNEDEYGNHLYLGEGDYLMKLKK